MSLSTSDTSVTAPAPVFENCAREALDNTIRNVPYNSASPFHEYFADASLPLAVGRACPWQSVHASERVAAATGRAPRYLQDGRHVAGVFVDDTATVVIDPYLMHSEPLVLPRHMVGTSISVPAFPIRRDPAGRPMPSALRGRLQPGGDILLEYTRYSPTRGHKVLKRRFKLAPDAVVSEVPPAAAWARPLLTHPEQNNLSVRTLTDDGLAEVVLPLDPESPAPTRLDLLARDNDGRLHTYGTSAFGALLASVAEGTGMAEDQVVSHLLEAEDIHRRRYPAGRPMPPYVKDDE